MLPRAVTWRTNRAALHFRPDARFRILPQALCIEVLMSIAKWFSCRVLLRTLSLTLAGALAAPAHAQVVRGVVVDEASGRGLPGIVVVHSSALQEARFAVTRPARHRQAAGGVRRAVRIPSDKRIVS